MMYSLKINNVYTLYSHDDIYQWYTSYTDQMLNPHKVKYDSPSIFLMSIYICPTT